MKIPSSQKTTGAEADLSIKGAGLHLKQTTTYPWKGRTKIMVNPAQPEDFSLYVRIPGWAQGRENPFDLYYSHTPGPVTLTLNGKKIAVQAVNGYVSIRRTWKKGDVVELTLPMQPRFVRANDSVQTIKGKLAIASGPVVYGFETVDNPGLEDYRIDPAGPLAMTYRPRLLNGINVITGHATDNRGRAANFTAIPFYSLGNRQPGAAYRVWVISSYPPQPASSSTRSIELTGAK